MKKILIAMFVLVSTMALSTAAEAASCEAHLRNTMRGTRTFHGWGYDRREACRDARRQCNQRLSRIRMRRPYTNAYCEVDRRGGGFGGQWVTRTCRAEKRGFRGEYRGTYYGQSHGRRGTGVQRRACDEALRQCQFSTFRREYCRVIR